MSQNWVWLVRFVEVLDLFVAEFHLGARHRLLDMSDLAGTHDRRGQSRLMKQPGVADSGIALAAL